MARLVIIGGSEIGTSFEIAADELTLGRQTGVEIKLNGTNVSRRHARVLRTGEAYFLEDLHSSNGTFLNGAKIDGRAPLKPRDEIRVGPYLLRFESGVSASDLTIHARTLANTANLDLYRENPARKLQVILELSSALGRSLELDALLSELLKHLFVLFPQAERGLVILLEHGELVIRAKKQRSPQEKLPRFSTSVVHKVLSEGTGIFAEDLQSDARFAEAESICSLGMRAFICVPLQSHSGQRFGVLQLDRTASGHRFTPEDLNLLTAIGLQASVALENARLHQELLAAQRIERELAMAREIQLGFLPTQIPQLMEQNFDLHAELFPAYEISGDFYDYFKLGEDRLAIAVADVSGKGMPAALFMSMVRALLRNFASPKKDAGTILAELNNAIAAQNPSCQFVTVHLSVYDCTKRTLEFASGGHPPCLLRRKNGEVEVLHAPSGPLLGFTEITTVPTHRIELHAGDLLLHYTDGITEAPSPTNEMFGVDRLRQALVEAGGNKLPTCAENIRKGLHAFTGSGKQEDDITLTLLRVN